MSTRNSKPGGARSKFVDGCDHRLRQLHGFGFLCVPLVDRADRLSEKFVVTKNGTPRAVLMSAEEFESWIETLELMSNPKTVKALEQGVKEAKSRKLASFKEA